MNFILKSTLLIFLIGCTSTRTISSVETIPYNTSYENLVEFFKEWRRFEAPPMRNGAPDYTAATFKKRYPEFKKLESKLNAFAIDDWSIPQQVDWYLVKAEVNGYDFNHHILKPWVRDPAYYKSLWMNQSDTPAHEGPTHHKVTELWTYEFPLNSEAEKKLISDLKVIQPLNEQAQINLTGNARDLWVAGIRDIKSQESNLKNLLEKVEDSGSKELIEVLGEAITSTNEFVKWLEMEAPKKTGPSGLGEDNYGWYMQHVHLVPLDWSDEVMILKRELARAWSSLKFEEHRNRHLPQLDDVDTKEAYDALAQRSARSLMSFLEEQDIMTVKDYFIPALDAQLGSFRPFEKRNFFTIGSHIDPRPLYSHFYHWFELARMVNEPNQSAIRREPALYNIFDSRNEGMATAAEEFYMQAGLYDDDPRVREIVYIMIAQRAARGLGSLYAHANDMVMEEAGKIHSEYTPRGWMKTEKELLIFEQHLYLRQPGYGTSYITGKHLLEETMMEFARTKELSGESFSIKDYFDTLNSIGNIPVSLASWELTGVKSPLLDRVKYGRKSF